MAILNATPDSFFDRSRVGDVSSAVERAGGFVREGAAILDIGGESTRPGAPAVSVEEQIERVVPIIRSSTDTAGAPRFEIPDNLAPIGVSLATGSGGLHGRLHVPQGIIDLISSIKEQVADEMGGEEGDGPRF